MHVHVHVHVHVLCICFRHRREHSADRSCTAIDADATSPKNGAGLRLGGGNLPLKIPSAMRKRAYDETMVRCCF